MDGVTVRRATLEEVFGLRCEVLFKGTNRPAAEYGEDRDPHTVHVAAFDAGRIVCCATFLPSEWNGQPAWQLRGMATEAGYRGRGLGGRVLLLGEELCRESGPDRAWCNARVAAVPFYERHGWRTVSEEFKIPGVGPHRRMAKEPLSPDRCPSAS
jgi:predicted GNAT family N-acyltransferase